MRAAALLLVLLLLVVAVGGCFFAPNIAPHGYVACAADADCEAGRLCELADGSGAANGLCAPPPWNDEEFGHRRVLVVTNESEEPMPAGTAVPVLLGGEGARAGVLGLEALGPDFRFTDFDPATRTWGVRAVHLDREEDRFTAWIPLARDLVQGRSDVLAWIESNSFAGAVAVTEDAAAVFAVGEYEAFDDAASSLAEPWTVRGAPTVDRGLVNIGDNESIILDRPFTGPIQANVIARVNGVNCTEVFVGFSGDEDAAFALPPAAGLFIDVVNDQLAGTALLGPVPVQEGGQLEERGGIAVSGGLMRISVNVDAAHVRVLVDDETVVDDALSTPFPDNPLYFAIHVGGACSLDVDALWITPSPLPPPTVTLGPLVELAL
jgi:hypothetical protein